MMQQYRRLRSINSGGHASAFSVGRQAHRLPEHSEIQCVCNFLAAVKNKTSHPSVRRAIKSINLITEATPAFMNYRALVNVFYHSAILPPVSPSVAAPSKLSFFPRARVTSSF